MPPASYYRDDPTACTPDILLRLGEGLMASGTIMAIFAPDDSLYYATPSFIALYDIQAGAQTFDSVMRHCQARRVGPNIETRNIDAWLAMAADKRRSQPVRRFEVDMIDGRWMWAIETTFEDGFMWLAVTDFTATKRREFTLRTARDAAIVASETDDLTGLFNRGAAMRRFDDVIKHSLECDDVFSAVLIDLDHFKAVNDRFGHDAGDQVLMHFAGCVREMVRENDIAGRVGGEEFLLVMPGATTAKATAVVERLQAYLRDQRLKVRDVTLRYTFSAGIAEWTPAKTLEGLYREADEALYLAKENGRDQVQRAG